MVRIIDMPKTGREAKEQGLPTILIEDRRRLAKIIENPDLITWISIACSPKNKKDRKNFVVVYSPRALKRAIRLAEKCESEGYSEFVVEKCYTPQDYMVHKG